MTKVFIHKENHVEQFDTDDVLQLLHDKFAKWSNSIGLYRNCISPTNRITLSTAADVLELAKIKDDLHVIDYPQGLAAIGIGLIVAAVGVQLFFANKEKKKTTKETASRKIPSAGSPNNGLSDRQNSERIEERVPDIYGKVRAVPDLIAPPYFIYKNNQEVEYALYAIGRGEFYVTDIRDGDTLVNRIAGSSVEIYAPGDYPTTIQQSVGIPIGEEIMAVKRNNNISGQRLLPPNAVNVVSSDRFVFFPNGTIEVNNNIDPPPGGPQPIDFEDYFEVGNDIVISGYGNANGQYYIVAVATGSVSVENPLSINGGWASFAADGTAQPATPITLATISDKRVGPFIIEDSSTAFFNVVAEGGLYRDDGTTQYRINAEIKISSQVVDENDTGVGEVYNSAITIYGSPSSRSRIAVTIRGPWNFNGTRFQVWAERVNTKDFSFVGDTVDKIVFESLYGVSPIAGPGIDEVTIVKSATFANPSSLALKERKLNMIVVRKIPLWDGVDSFSAPTATSNFADIVVDICKDPLIGNRTDAEIDFTSIYHVRDELLVYFGTEITKEFNYTFDDDNLSFEEIISMVAESVFSIAYREGNKIKFRFEKENDVSRLLFNHRNKLPGTEKRTFNFGRIKDIDGVEVKYVDTMDGATLTYHLPMDQSAVNPEVVDIAGITWKLQARFHAHRAWNKIQYRNTNVEFEATQEANLLVRGDRILVADNTRPQTWDGEIIGQAGLVLTLSSRFEPEIDEEYIIFLQMPDGTVESIPCYVTDFPDKVTLDHATSIPLAIGSNLYAGTSYEITQETSTRQRAFLIEEKQPQDNFNSQIAAYNYDARYYQNDADFIDEVVDLFGNLIP